MLVLRTASVKQTSPDTSDQAAYTSRTFDLPFQRWTLQPLGPLVYHGPRTLTLKAVQLYMYMRGILTHIYNVCLLRTSLYYFVFNKNNRKPVFCRYSTHCYQITDCESSIEAMLLHNDNPSLNQVHNLFSHMHQN